MSSRPYFEIANPELPRLLRGLPRGLDVLDVACGSGVHGAELKRLYGHRVIGVDLSAASVEKAKTRLAEAYVADIIHPERYPKFGRSRFDVIVLSDILEHVGDPLDVVARHLPLLVPGGYFLISLPNIAIWNVRFELLLGRFEYQDTGTLDRTHMRFFTRRSLRRFLAEAGLEVRGSRITPGITRPFVPLIKRIYAHRIPNTQAGGILRPLWIRRTIASICGGSILSNTPSAVYGPVCSPSSWSRSRNPLRSGMFRQSRSGRSAP